MRCRYLALCSMFTAAAALTLPVLRVPRAVMPLDTCTLTMQRHQLDKLHDSAAARGLVGVVAASEHAVDGAVGTLCEFTRCDAVVTDQVCAVRAVGFARFRVVSGGWHCDGRDDAGLSSLDVVPHKDTAPEDGEALRALEMRAHLLFQAVEQLCSWSGGAVSISATSASLGPEGRRELGYAVRRFAPLAEHRLQPPDECALLNDDPDDDEGDACQLLASDICRLERAFLRASHGLVDDDGAEAASTGLAAFACERQELYSFAVSRLHDQSPAEAQALLDGRDTALRLHAAERELGATRTWLTSRLGLTVPSEAGVDGAASWRDRLTRLLRRL